MPIVNGLEDEFAGDVAVIRLNAADRNNAAIQSRYGLRGHPSFAVLDSEGEVADSFFGPQSAETLRAAMDNVGPD